MKTKVRKHNYFFSLLGMAFLFFSCADFFLPENSAHTPGMVTIHLNAAEARTFLPQSLHYRYRITLSNSNLSLAFSRTLDSKSDQAPSDLTISLEQGSWTVSAIRYEVREEVEYPVASGTAAFLLQPGSSPEITVAMDPISQGTGVFSCKVFSALAASGTLEFRQAKEDGFVSTLPLSITANGTVIKTIPNVPAGDYDVTVILNSGSAVAGKYSAAHIYSGLVTEALDENQGNYFHFSAAHFVSTVYLEGNLSGITGITPQPGNSVTVTAYKSAASEKAGTGVNAATVSIPYSGNSGSNWRLAIDPGISSVDLEVKVQGNDSRVYIMKKAAVLTNIQVNGRDNISVALGARKFYALNLTSLSVAAAGASEAISWTPAFSPETRAYDIRVPYAVPGVTVTGTAESGALVTGLAYYPLAEGPNQISVTLAAPEDAGLPFESGNPVEQRTYTLNITRTAASSTNTIKEYILNFGGETPPQTITVASPNTASPTIANITVNAGITITITAVPTDPLAKVYALDGNSFGAVSGIEEFRFMVIPEDPNTSPRLFALELLVQVSSEPDPPETGSSG